MQNVGSEEFDYNSFKQAYDTDPLTQGLVTRFDQNGVELKTKKGNNDTAPSDAEARDKSVEKMAKRATAKAIG